MEGGVRAGEERGAEKQMDEYLKSMGLVRKRIAKDGSCLFRAVAEQVLHCQNLHTEIRAKCVDFLRQNRSDYEAFIEGDFEGYLFKLQDPQQWVGEVEIHALSVMYKRDFLIYQEPGKPAVHITDNNFKDKVQLCFLNGNHYDCVYPDEHIRKAALCQSVLYELLYDGVFKVDRSLLKLCHRTGRASDLLSDDGMAACRSSDDSDGGADEPLWVENETSSTSTKATNQSYKGRGRGRQLPERVRRSLNPTLLRNVEYDVWHKTKRAQQKMDYSIAAGMHFTVGDRCQVRLENGRSYSATVREVPPKNGPVSVYVEELGVRQVPLWSLQPAREDGGWNTVVGRDRKLSNGHGDWEEPKGRGRGRGRSTPASSSNPAAGSGGRVQKQQSWPATDEPGKSSRKSLSSVDLAFGLTEKQRLAREEEERNVALVEIQMRDELSFPALGKQTSMSSEGGKRKGEKRNSSQRNKTKSPVEDERPSSPSCTAPAPGATMTTSGTVAPAPDANAPVPVAPVPVAPVPVAPVPVAPAPVAPAPVAPAPVAPSKSAAPELSFLSDSTLDVTTATGSAPKAAAPSCASVAPPPPFAPLPPAAPPSVPASAGVFSFLAPALPPASAPPPPASPPTFIAPIAPSPTGFAPRPASSPPPLARPIVTHQEAPPPLAGTHGKSPQNQIQVSAPQHQNQSPAPVLQQQDIESQRPEPPIQNQNLQHQETVSSRPQVQSPALPIQNQSLQHQETTSSRPQVQSSEVQDQNTMPPGAQVQTLSPEAGLRYQDQEVPAAPARFQSPGLQNPQTLTPPTEIQTQSPPLQDQYTEPSRPQVQSQGPTPVPQTEAPPPPKTPPVLGPAHLQQLPQVYQDLLYPGFPHGDKGNVAPTLNFSSSKSGDDLPRDMNVLRFFYNLGVKAYSMPMCFPYLYILPLMQAHFLQPPSPPRSPSPQCPPANPPTRPQDPQPPPYSAPGYPAPVPPPPPQQLPWQTLPPPRNPAYPTRYPPPVYPVPPSSQGYHMGQVPGHPVYPPVMPQYPHPSLGYQSQPPPEDLQARQGAMDPSLHPGGHPGPGMGHVPGPGLLEVPPGAANVANANTNRAVMAASGFGGREAGESVGRGAMLMDASRHMVTLVSDADRKDAAASGRSLQGSPSPYRGHVPAHVPTLFLPQGAPLHSVGCGTEDSWEEAAAGHSRGGRGRGHRGGRGRGQGQGQRRRYPGDMGAGLSYTQFTPSHRGRGYDRGY